MQDEPNDSKADSNRVLYSKDVKKYATKIIKNTIS